MATRRTSQTGGSRTTKVTESARNERGQEVSRSYEQSENQPSVSTSRTSQSSPRSSGASNRGGASASRSYAGALGPSRGKQILAGAWFAGMVVIGWQEVSGRQDMPKPQRFVGWTVLMGILDLIAPIVSWELSSVFAVGFLIGLMIFRTKPKPDPGLKNLPPGSKRLPNGDIQTPNGTIIPNTGGKNPTPNPKRGGVQIPNIPPGLS